VWRGHTPEACRPFFWVHLLASVFQVVAQQKGGQCDEGTPPEELVLVQASSGRPGHLRYLGPYGTPRHCGTWRYLGASNTLGTSHVLEWCLGHLDLLGTPRSQMQQTLWDMWQSLQCFGHFAIRKLTISRCVSLRYEVILGCYLGSCSLGLALRCLGIGAEL
jgi:hypothetical protein